jgi:hypothetical protein
MNNPDTTYFGWLTIITDGLMSLPVKFMILKIFGEKVHDVIDKSKRPERVR